jgi:hypothetical protein
MNKKSNPPASATAPKTTAATATARPWKAVQESVDPEWFCLTANGGQVACNALGQENASLIVSAVNQFDALQAVAEAAREVAKTTDCTCTIEHRSQNARCLLCELEASLAALDKVKGGAA